MYQIQPGRLFKVRFTRNNRFLVWRSSFYYKIEKSSFATEVDFLCWKSWFMWKIVLFWSENRKTRFLHKNSASRKLRLLILIKRNIYQTQPDGLLKALFAKNLIFLFEKRVFSQNVRKFVLCLKSTFCGEIVFCVEI